MVKTSTGKSPESPEDIVVTDGEVRSWKAMKGTKAAMKNLHGEDWGDEEVKLFIQAKRFEKWQEELVNEVESQERFKKYMEAFENYTPNDEQMVLAMCSIEVQLENIRKTLEGGKISDVAEIQKLSKAQTDLLKEHRQLQGALGIQRQDRKTHKETALELIKEEIERGRQFMKDKLIAITHEGCNIQEGWVLYSFQELPYKCQFTCPRCGGDIIIEGGDPEETKKVIEGMRTRDGE